MNSDSTKTFEDTFSPIRWVDGVVEMLDQRLLPATEQWNRYTEPAEVADAIRAMVIRGAPAIGCAAAYGVAAAARGLPDEPAAFQRGFEAACERLAASRPTAVNLFWALERQRGVLGANMDRGVDAVRQALEREALAIHREDIASCREMGRLGAELIPHGATVLTHCNTGGLATGGYGTALGVIRAAAEAGKEIKVLADETRPFLQGARLTAWELMRDDIDVTLITDSMAGHFMKEGLVDCVVVGSDRTARNGDVANKIGTYSVAVLAHHNEVPFYVALPRTTIDLDIASGEQIPIEERPDREVTHVGQTQITPDGCAVRNVAFDVTPNELVAAIITEAGVARPPYEESIPALFEDRE